MITNDHARRFSTICSIVAAICFLPSYAQAGFLFNGGFETYVQGGPTYLQGQVIGGGNLPGWSVDVVPGTNSFDHSVDLEDNSFGSYFAHSGTRSIDLEGSNAPNNWSGSISQSVNTTVGTAYTLEFYMGGNYYGPSPLNSVKQLEVLWNGVSKGVFSYSLHPGDTIQKFTWDRHTVVLFGQAASGGDRLTFRSYNPSNGGFGALVDDISLNASTVPEPGTLMMWFASMSLTSLVVRGQRRKGRKVFSCHT